jgi:hypothetical protein
MPLHRAREAPKDIAALDFAERAARVPGAAPRLRDAPMRVTRCRGGDSAFR